MGRRRSIYTTTQRYLHHASRHGDAARLTAALTEARDFYRLEQLLGEVPARAMEPVQS